MTTLIKNNQQKTHKSFSNSRWTLQQKSTLIEKYRLISIGELCEILGKTPKAISMKAARLGLNKNVISNQLNLSLSEKPVNWTDKQIYFLKNYYGKLANSTIVICDPFIASGITIQQIADKAYELGITKVKHLEPDVDLYNDNNIVSDKKKSRKKKRFFDNTEVKMLQNLIDSNIELKVVEIARLLDRDPSSISKKIKELKTLKTKNK
jgi:hypothetical protein